MLNNESFHCSLSIKNGLLLPSHFVTIHFNYLFHSASIHDRSYCRRACYLCPLGCQQYTQQTTNVNSADNNRPTAIIGRN